MLGWYIILTMQKEDKDYCRSSGLGKWKVRPQHMISVGMIFRPRTKQFFAPHNTMMSLFMEQAAILFIIHDSSHYACCQIITRSPNNFTFKSSLACFIEVAMTLFCYFSHNDSGDVSCFFGLNDKIAAMSHCSAENTVSSIREFHFPEAQGNSLISLALSTNNLYLVGAYSNKAVVCWDVQTGAVAGQCVVHKKPTALVCSCMSSSSSFALISEKGGEVWAYPLPSLSKTVKLLGHTSSVITDMTISPDGSRIVTADRDEKIRLTSFPDTSTIAGYCLGHTDVVTSVAFLSPSSCSSPLLLSAGWDHRLSLWDPQSCVQLDVLALAPPPHEQAQAQQAQEVLDTKTDEADEGEEDETAADKVYDETKAGHFPLRVVVAQPGSDTFAVLFWNKPQISLYRVQQGQEEEQGGAQFLRGAGEDAALAVLQLPAAPVDCVLLDGDRSLLVLLPAPHHWLALALPGGAPLEESCRWTTIARHFSAVAAQSGE